MDNLFDEIAAYERELEAKAKKEIAEERAAWDALPQAEKDRINAEKEAEAEALQARIDASEAANDDDDDDDDDDEFDGRDVVENPWP